MEKQLAAMSSAGEQFMFQAQEARELQQLNRLSSLSSSYSQQAAVYGSQEGKMLSSALGGAASIGMGFMGSGENNNDDPPEEEEREIIRYTEQGDPVYAEEKG